MMVSFDQTLLLSITFSVNYDETKVMNGMFLDLRSTKINFTSASPLATIVKYYEMLNFTLKCMYSVCKTIHFFPGITYKVTFNQLGRCFPVIGQQLQKGFITKNLA